MINTARFNDLQRVVASAVDHGATVDVGGGPFHHPYLESGAYFVPTVVGNVDPLSDLAQHESKGSCLRNTRIILNSLFPSVCANCYYHTVRDFGPSY